MNKEHKKVPKKECEKRSMPIRELLEYDIRTKSLYGRETVRYSETSHAIN